MSGAFIVLDAEWRCTFVNRRAAEIFGRRVEDIIGKYIWAECPGDVGQPFYDACHRALAEQTPLQTEEYDALSDRWFENRIDPSPDGLSIYFHDITDRKKAEAALEESAARLRTIIETEPECLKVISADGRLLEMNPAGLAMLEAGSLPEVQQCPLVEFLAPEYRAGFGALHRRVMQGESGIFEFEAIGLRGRRRWLETHATPLRDSAGGIQAVLGVTRDITERREAEAALRESERRYRTLAELTSDFAYSFRVEPDGTMRGTWVSEAFVRIFEMSLPEIEARGGWHTLIFPEDFAIATGHAMRVIGREIDVCEMRFVTKSGRVVWMRDHARPVWSEAEGRVVGIEGAAQDITERKLADALNDGQKRVLEMIALGTPLPETLAALARVIEAQSPEMLCSVLLLDADGAHLRHGAGPSLPDAFNRAIDGVAIGARVGSCGTAAFRGEAVFVEDIAGDPLWADYRDLALAHGLRACWSTPIFDAQRKLVGTFAIYYRQPATPTPRHRQLIDVGTHIAAIAIGRERTEKALRASEARSRRLADSNLIGIMFADFAGHILDANDAFLRMVGYTREELLSGVVRWHEMTPPEWRAADERAIAELKARGECAPFEKEYLRKDGSRVPILVGIAIVEGTPDAGVCFVLDMTGLKRAERTMREQLDELRRWHAVTLGREDRVAELKREVNELAARLGGPPRYASEASDSSAP